MRRPPKRLRLRSLVVKPPLPALAAFSTFVLLLYYLPTTTRLPVWEAKKRYGQSDSPMQEEEEEAALTKSATNQNENGPGGRHN